MHEGLKFIFQKCEAALALGLLVQLASGFLHLFEVRGLGAGKVLEVRDEVGAGDTCSHATSGSDLKSLSRFFGGPWKRISS